MSNPTAKPEDVLRGYSFIGESGEKEFGTIENIGEIHKEIGAGEVYLIEEGYHNGNGTIKAKSFKDATPGNVTPETMKAGKIAYVNGEQVIGKVKTIPNGYEVPAENIIYDGKSIILQIPEGIYEDSENVGLQPYIIFDKSTIATNCNITPDIIRKGATIFGILGTFTQDANATENDILEGRTAYVNGNKITGKLRITSIIPM